MAVFRYISHPNVHQDPAVPVPQWVLSDEGRARTIAMLDQPWWANVTQLACSNEIKALETATIISNRLGLDIDIRPATREVDRSSTGFVPADEHDALADALFAHPHESAQGWERAIDAQQRVLTAVGDLLIDGAGDAVIVGHGGVGTLLMCHLAPMPIDRRHDQPGQGHYWTYDRSTATLLHRWRPVEAIER